MFLGAKGLCIILILASFVAYQKELFKSWDRLVGTFTRKEGGEFTDPNMNIFAN